MTDLEFLAGTRNDQDVNVLEGLISPQDENNANGDNGDLNALEDLGNIFNFSNISLGQFSWKLALSIVESVCPSSPEKKIFSIDLKIVFKIRKVSLIELTTAATTSSTTISTTTVATTTVASTTLASIMITTTKQVSTTEIQTSPETTSTQITSTTFENTASGNFSTTIVASTLNSTMTASTLTTKTKTVAAVLDDVDILEELLVQEFITTEHPRPKIGPDIPTPISAVVILTSYNVIIILPITFLCSFILS